MVVLPGCRKDIIRQRIDDSRLLKYANDCRLHDNFTDITISIGNIKILANRMVLSCYSKYFEEIFLEKDNDHSPFGLKDMSREAVTATIDFIYSGEILINNKNVIGLLIAACRLKVDDLLKYCIDYLESSISFDTCFFLLNAANLYKLESLKEQVLQFMSENFDAISQRIEFRNLVKSDLVSCISLLDRSEFSEMQLYEAIISWVKYDEVNRKKDFPELFQLINLDKISDEYLLRIAEETLIKQNHSCSFLMMKRLAYAMKENKMKESGTRIVSLGGYKTPTKVTELYSLTRDSAKTFPPLPINVQRHCSLYLNGSVYCIGGFTVDDDPLVIRKVWQLDLNAEILDWKEIAEMNECRQVMGAALFNNAIVVAGGHDGGFHLTSVEVNIKALEEWKAIASLNQCRSGHALVACDECLYAIGGYSQENGYISTVEKLHGLKSKWKFVEPMNTPRRWLAAVSVDDCIYAIGGESDNGYNARLSSVEKYDPALDEWTDVCDMNFERVAHAACVLQNKIFVAGGLDAENHVVKEIECYDPTLDSWAIVGKTEDNLYNYSLVVI